ncbi:MAG TPA: ice-binding family protein, partial [Bacteroidia bacterium]|nr:ice-binding family protein [Bacteroidia bacterium]
VFTDTLYLNAEGDANAVFVIRVVGAFSTSVYSKVILINGTQSKNVFWQIEGAVKLNNYSVFCGTIICHNGALGAINTGVNISGRLLTTNGALTTTAVTVVATNIPNNCGTVGISSIEDTRETVTVYPNPFHNSTTVMINDLSQINNCEFRMYDVLGNEVMHISLINQTSTLDMSKLSSGVYFYQLIDDNKLIQSGKLVSVK